MKRHMKRKHGGGEAIKRHSGGNLEIKLQQINRMMKEYVLMENVDNMEEDHTGQWTLNYAFLEKEYQKCSTLNSCLHTDFHRNIVKFCTNLY